MISGSRPLIKTGSSESQPLVSIHWIYDASTNASVKACWSYLAEFFLTLLSVPISLCFEQDGTIIDNTSRP